MMAKSLRFGVLSCIFLIGQVGAVNASDCAFLKLDPANLRDGQLFFQVKGSGSWVSFDDTVVDLGNQNVSYAYVMRERLDPARSGVIVLKSGRARQPDEPQQTRQSKQVLLVRRADAADNKKCGPVTEFGERPVSAKSYDDYHDQGLNVPEIKTIRAFHMKYAARSGRCRHTDDNGPDSLLPLDLRSNRGQFSFDPDVVARGTYSQVLAWAGASQASASSDRLADQRVEIRQYEVVGNAPTCVQFSLPVQGRSSFLKINDLEALTQSGLNFLRSGERNWSLSR